MTNLLVPDYTHFAPFEWIARAAVERAYGAMLAWVLGDHSGIELADRLGVARSLGLQAPPDADKLQTQLEYRHIDLLVTAMAGDHASALAVELKLASQERPAQLSRYDKVVSRCPTITSQTYLSLVPPISLSSSQWNLIALTDLALALQSLTQRYARNVYLKDYYEALCRLSNAVRLVKNEEGGCASLVFGETPRAALPSGFENYVNGLRLRVVLQRAWMHSLLAELRARVPSCVGLEQKIGETHGVAFLEFSLPNSREPGVRAGLQIQRRALKAFAQPDPYVRDASQQVKTNCAAVLSELAGHLGITGTMSRTKARGFVSIPSSIAATDRIVKEWTLCLETKLASCVRFLLHTSADGSRQQ